MSKKLRIFVIGCGLIGNKRSLNIDSKLAIVKLCADTNSESAKKFARKFKTEIVKDYKRVDFDKFDVVFISTTHNNLFEISNFFLKKKKHVLVEKPGSLNFNQIKELYSTSLKNKKSKIAIGYNHRFHPAFIKAKEIISSGLIGKIMFIRAQYGHGGRIGYNKEWRAKKNISGGGELIDQGTHLIDLSQFFLGKLNFKEGVIKRYYWNMKVEDNCFLILENKSKNIAFLQASCTEWKNTFNFEIYGKLGKLQIYGLGGSYGTETLKFYKMKKKLGPPDTMIYEFPKKDESWKEEQNNFFNYIFKKEKAKFATVNDAKNVLELVNKVYKKNDNI